MRQRERWTGVWPTTILFLATIVHAAEKDQLSAVIWNAVSTPNAVEGSDGAVHLVYELQLTNATNWQWKLEKLEALANDGTGRVLVAYASDKLVKRIDIVGMRQPTAELAPGQSAIAWFHVIVPSAKDVPASLVHRLTAATDEIRATQTGAEVGVVRDTPPLLGPPLTGKGWIAADGCCDAPRHIRALMAVNGKLYLAQRFAIDWEKIDENGKIYVGDRHKPESYACYNQPIIAAADAVVVEAVDRYEDQVPGALPGKMTIEEADGNHVILDLGGGRYALNAHMKRQSIQVKVGDRVVKGQLLGHVGNTGNTSAPHLHFHVMSRPSALAADGLPYRMTKFAWRGQVPSTAVFDEAEAKGTVLPFSIENAGWRADVLPLDQSIIDFPEGP